MTLRYDLHSHSTASDGTLTPGGLVARAIDAGVDVLALTDHDNTDGLAEATRAAAGSTLQLVPGIEISVTWNHHVVHIVGLGIEAQNSALQQGLSGLHEFREWRAREIARRLALAGIEGAYEGARNYANGRLISRTHFARFLVERGHAPDTRKVFKHFLVRGKPGYVPGQWAALGDAVAWITDAGGEAVIAHPARYPFTRTKLRRLMQEFREAGGVAIEVISGSHSVTDNQTMARHARELELRGSAGSDYHGPENPWIDLGRLPEMPADVIPVWQNWSVCKAALTA